MSYNPADTLWIVENSVDNKCILLLIVERHAIFGNDGGKLTLQSFGEETEIIRGNSEPFHHITRLYS